MVRAAARGQAVSCNLDDGEGRCTGGEDGEPCEACAQHFAAEAAYHRALYDAASPLERLAVARGVRVEELEEYEDEMRDAGRGRWQHD